MFLFVDLLNYTKQYFYTTVEDETLFREYMQYMYYYNGVIGFDDKNPPSKYFYKTSYKNGDLYMDVNHDVRYEYGTVDTSINAVTYDTGGRLWLMD